MYVYVSKYIGQISLDTRADLKWNVYINTKNQLADLLTKALQGFVLRPLYWRLGLLHC